MSRRDEVTAEGAGTTNSPRSDMPLRHKYDSQSYRSLAPESGFDSPALPLPVPQCGSALIYGSVEIGA